MWRLRQAAFALCLALASTLVAARSVLAVSFPPRPPDQDFFVDEANLLRPADAAEVDRIAGSLLAQEQVPIFVVTISSLGSQGAAGVGIESYAKQLFDHWGIGRPDRNYGMLLLVSVGDRKARIELGAAFDHRYDPESNEIMQRLIVPAFKRGDFSTGIVDGVRGLDAMARGLNLPHPTPPWWYYPALVLGTIFVLAMIVNLFRTGHSGWAWALIVLLAGILWFTLRSAASSSSGSSGGFGGGSSGGGGATGSW